MGESCFSMNGAVRPEWYHGSTENYRKTTYAGAVLQWRLPEVPVWGMGSWKLGNALVTPSFIIGDLPAHSANEIKHFTDVRSSRLVPYSWEHRSYNSESWVARLTGADCTFRSVFSSTFSSRPRSFVSTYSTLCWQLESRGTTSTAYACDLSMATRPWYSYCFCEKSGMF